MFSSGFLSGANPLSKVSSAVNKFSLFGDEEAEEEGASSTSSEEDEDVKQKPAQPQKGKAAGKSPQQQGSKATPQQGSPGQGRGPTQQKTPPQPKGPAQPGAQKQSTMGEQGPNKGRPPGMAGLNPAGPPTQSAGKAAASGQKSVCPLCKTTELNLQSKEQPNYNTCTQCKSVVCSLCGFSPPDSAAKEWLCLNCQMQRALGAMEPPGPPMLKAQPQAPKQVPGKASALASPQNKQAPLENQADKTTESRKSSALAKQEPVTDTGQPGALPGASPAAPKGLDQSKSESAPAVKKPAEQMQQAATAQKTLAATPKVDPKTGRPLQDPGRASQPMPKGAQGPPAAKSAPPPQAQAPKQESSFFGLSFGGLTEAAKPQSSSSQSAAESVTGKLFGFGGQTEAAKPQSAAPQPPAESVTGKLFGFGGQTEAAKSQPASSKSADSVSGKVFGFGSSIFSSASNLISSTVQDEHPSQGSASAPLASQQGKGPPPQEKKPPAVKVDKPSAEPLKGAPPPGPSSEASSSACPLCKVELNVGSQEPPNYNTCTECRKTVCNLCGFNPMPHLNESEWLCLNCQTQRALAGQLGDMGVMPPPMPSPSKQSAPNIQSAPGKEKPDPTVVVPAEDASQDQQAGLTVAVAPTAAPKLAPDHNSSSVPPAESTPEAAVAPSDSVAAVADVTPPLESGPISKGGDVPPTPKLQSEATTPLSEPACTAELGMDISAAHFIPPEAMTGVSEHAHTTQASETMCLQPALHAEVASHPEPSLEGSNVLPASESTQPESILVAEGDNIPPAFESIHPEPPPVPKGADAPPASESTYPEPAAYTADGGVPLASESTHPEPMLSPEVARGPPAVISSEISHCESEIEATSSESPHSPETSNELHKEKSFSQGVITPPESVPFPIVLSAESAISSSDISDYADSDDNSFKHNRSNSGGFNISEPTTTAPEADTALAESTVGVAENIDPALNPNIHLVPEDVHLSECKDSPLEFAHTADAIYIPAEAQHCLPEPLCLSPESSITPESSPLEDNSSSPDTTAYFPDSAVVSTQPAESEIIGTSFEHTPEAVTAVPGSVYSVEFTSASAVPHPGSETSPHELAVSDEAIKSLSEPKYIPHREEPEPAQPLKAFQVACPELSNIPPQKVAADLPKPVTTFPSDASETTVMPPEILPWISTVQAVERTQEEISIHPLQMEETLQSSEVRNEELFTPPISAERLTSAPSDLARSERTIISKQETQLNTTGDLCDVIELETLPKSTQSQCAEELLKEAKSVSSTVSPTTVQKKDYGKQKPKGISRGKSYCPDDFVEDSGLMYISTLGQGGQVSEDPQQYSQYSGEEETLRKQIMEMSKDLNESDHIHGQKYEQGDWRSKVKDNTEQSKQDFERTFIHVDDTAKTPQEIEELWYGESAEMRITDTGEEHQHLRKTDLSTNAEEHKVDPSQQTSVGLDLEMESPLISPEDKSKGEGSSSLHASSFTPGTSPSSVSSMEEDSDSSPSHRMKEENRQRKARHRQSGHVLAVIEDSSEEEKAEQDLPKDQYYQKEVDQQLKGSSCNTSKNEKELETDGRREHLVTPLRTLSSTEEVLQQSKEMQEQVMPSAGSPSVNSGQEALKANAGKILILQKTFEQLASVYQYSSTDQKHVDVAKDIHEILVPEQQSNRFSFQESMKKLRSPEEVYEDIQKKHAMTLKKQELSQCEPVNETPLQETVLTPSVSETCYVTISPGDKDYAAKNKKTVASETASTTLTPGTSFTQPGSNLQDFPEVTVISSKRGTMEEHELSPPVRSQKSDAELIASPDVGPTRVLYPVPDLKITTCSSGEEDVEEEDYVTQNEVVVQASDIQIHQGVAKVEDTSVKGDAPAFQQTVTHEMEPVSVVCEVPQQTVGTYSSPAHCPAHAAVRDSADVEPLSVVCEIPQAVTGPSKMKDPAPVITPVAEVSSAMSTVPSVPSPAMTVVAGPRLSHACDQSPALATTEMESISVITEVPKSLAIVTPPTTRTSTPVTTSGLTAAEMESISVVCEVPQSKDMSVSLVPKLGLSAASLPVSAPAAVSQLIPRSAPEPVQIPTVQAYIALKKTPLSSVPAQEQVINLKSIPASGLVSAPTPESVTVVVQTSVPPPALKACVDLVSSSGSLSSTPSPLGVPFVSQTPPPPPVTPRHGTTQVQSVVVDIQPTVNNAVPLLVLPAQPETPLTVSRSAPLPYALPSMPHTPGHVIISVPVSESICLTANLSKELPVVSTMTACPGFEAGINASSAFPSSPSSLSSPLSATPSPTTIPYVPTHSPVTHGTVLYPSPTCTPWAPSSPRALLRSQEKVEKPVAAPPPPLPASPIPLPTQTPLFFSSSTSTADSTCKPHVHSSVLSPVSTSVSLGNKLKETAPPLTIPKHIYMPITSQTVGSVPVKSTAAHSITTMTLNLSASTECKISSASPRSPLSPRTGSSSPLHGTYVVITLPSQPSSPTESLTTQAHAEKPSTHLSKAVHSTVPVTRTQFMKSVEYQQIQAADRVVSNTTHLFSSHLAHSQCTTLPDTVSQVVTTTEVQRTAVSVIYERLPPAPALKSSSIAINIPPEMTKVHVKPKENGKTHFSGDVVDLRTLKISVPMTEKGMDLSSPDSRRQSFSSDGSGRQASAVQSTIVNLSTETTPATTLSFVTDSVTIVTCASTVSYDSMGDRPLTQSSTPLHTATSKTFEPLAQIIYKPLDTKPINSFSAVAPINLSFGVSTGVETSKSPLRDALSSMTNGLPVCVETGVNGAVDLTTTKPVQTVVSLEEATAKVIVVEEDDGKPMDLTRGRRTVCCDVVYTFPFAGMCRKRQQATTLPEDRFGYRDDHYQYNRSGPAGAKSFSGLKSSMSDTNLAEAGLFVCKSRNSYDFNTGSVEGAIDLTSGKMPTGEIMGYTSKAMEPYSRMNVPPYSQTAPAAGTPYGINSLLKYSNGVVYSSVAAPVPSTYAVTTQPASIFGSAYKDFSGIHSGENHCSSPSYGFLTAPTMTEGGICLETGKVLLSPAFPEVVPTAAALPNAYIDASLDAFATPLLQGSDGSNDQHYQMERELLELEKMKQLRHAEELEWERQQIQRYREQEQILIQQELEKLQSMKQQLLFQQEEERQAHLLMQQETYAQHQLQLEQIHQLQQQLQLNLEEEKMREMYGYDPCETLPPLSSSEQVPQDAQHLRGDNSHLWPVQDDTADPQHPAWYSVPTQANSQQMPSDSQKKIVDSGVQTDGEDVVDRAYPGKKRRNRKSVDSSVQTDDEDQDDWEVPSRSRRRTRSNRSGDGSRLSSIAIQTVAEISVQTDPSGSLKRPSVKAHVDTKVELSPPERGHRGRSGSSERRSPQRDDKRPAPLEISYTNHLKADSSSVQLDPSPPKSPKVLYSPISPLSPKKCLEYMSYEKSVGDSSSQKVLPVESSRVSETGPRASMAGQRTVLDPNTACPMADTDGHLGKGTQKKVKRTLPTPPPEGEVASSQICYSTGSARRRLCRNITMARAKILQDIDRELDLVERESSKLRKKQAELDEEEKEIDAKLRYLEMGINRRREALLKEREKRERDYLQGVAEERDYMSDSEVSNIRDTRTTTHGMERPKTAPQSELSQFIPPQGQQKDTYAHPTSPYSQYQYGLPTRETPQTHYQSLSFYDCQQVSPYQSQSVYSDATLSYPQPRGYQHQLMQQKAQQTALSDLEPKVTTNFDVMRDQPVTIGPSSADTGYDLPHLGGKYSNLNLRMGLDERGSLASSPMSSISADSFYTDVGHHAQKNYVLMNDVGELPKGSAGLPSSFSIPDKDLVKAERLLRAAELRGYMGPMQASSRLHPCMKVQEDAMEEPYELKLLKQQIKQEFRRSTGGLDPLTGLPHCYSGDSSYRHVPRAEKYSIGRLTLEKQAAKQLPASVLYQKQAKLKKALLDPKLAKFSSVHENRDLGLDYGSYLAPGTASLSGLTPRARLLQDDITFGLRKNIAEQQKYLGSTLGANLAHSLNLGQNLSLSPHTRSSLQEEAVYTSGSRSRPSSRPTSVYGLDLSIKRDLSSSSLRLKLDSEGTSLLRTKPTSLPISQSRGRIPIVAQNSEEESPLSPVGQPMGMARASAGPLPPISADLRDQLGSSHSLPEVQQHMKEESRSRAELRSRVLDRDIALLMEDIHGAMTDSEAYHLQPEETDWFNKPREGHLANGTVLEQRLAAQKHMQRDGQMRLSYPFPYTRVRIQRDLNDHSVSGGGFGIRVVGGKEIPGNSREIGAYVAKVLPGGSAEQTGKIVEGMQILEWNGISLTGKTYEDVQGIVAQCCGEAELCLRLDLNMLSDPDQPQLLELLDHAKAGERQRSPGVDPKQLAAELHKVSQQQTASPGLSGAEKGPPQVHSGAMSNVLGAVHSQGQLGSPSVNKKRHSTKPAEATRTQSHPITGDIQLQINYDRTLGNLIVHVLQARNLAPRDNNGYSDPFVKVYLLPGRGAENKRRSRSTHRSLNPEWNQTVIYKNIHLEQLKKKTLEVSVWDYDRLSSNDFLGEVLIDLSNMAQLDNSPRWLPLKEQSDTVSHGHTHLGQGSPAPKSSVIKSRSHGIFPDPSKDMQVPTIEKSHSSPGSSKSSSEGHLRSHGPSRSQSKSNVTQTHLEDATAASDTAGQQLRHQSARPGLRAVDGPLKATPKVSSFAGSEFILDEEDGEDAVDSAIFQVPQIGKTIPNGTDSLRGLDIVGSGDSLGKTQMTGEIKVALKKETKTEGEQLVVEILQCRNITYKFKSPDHLPDLYVKLYVVNVATQKKVVKKKTRVCRHDREPSFNETFRFSLNPSGHSIQLFLVSNGGKFVKKTLVGEAYIWLDKVDLRKRSTSWHKLLASSPQNHS